MKKYWAQWNLIRLVRFVFGIFIIIQAIDTAQWIFIIPGAFLAVLALFNLGCNSSQSCRSTVSKRKS